MTPFEADTQLPAAGAHHSVDSSTQCNAENSSDDSAAAAKGQAEQLRADSSQLLLELLQAQQHKLSEMVRQLRYPTTPAMSGPAGSAVILPSFVPPAQPPSAGQTLTEVLRLQQGNLSQLDVLLNRIHATMADGLSGTEPQAGQLPGATDHGKNSAAV